MHWYFRFFRWKNRIYIGYIYINDSYGSYLSPHDVPFVIIVFITYATWKKIQYTCVGWDVCVNSVICCCVRDFSIWIIIVVFFCILRLSVMSTLVNILLYLHCQSFLSVIFNDFLLLRIRMLGKYVRIFKKLNKNVLNVCYSLQLCVNDTDRHWSDIN